MGTSKREILQGLGILGVCAAHKNAGGELPESPRPLQRSIQAAQDAQRDVTFQETHPEMRDGQLAFDEEPALAQPASDLAGVKVEVQFHEFHLLQGIRAPFLPAQQIAQDGFQVAFVGKLQDENRLLCQHLADLLEGAFAFFEVVDGADHGGSIEDCRSERQVAGVGSHIAIARGITQPRARLLQLSARIIEQGDLLKAGVARGVAPGSGAQLQQVAAALGQQAAQGDGFCGVFVCPPAFLPEGFLIVRTLVIANRWFCHFLFPLLRIGSAVKHTL